MITLGTDCSGIGAPEIAISRLGQQFRYVFASESDPCCRRILEASQTPPEIISDDATKRSAAPPVDLYISGFCCQPYSGIGLRQCFEDERDTFFSILKYLRESQPKTFLLENVKAIMSYPNVWSTVVGSLQSIWDTEGDQAAYQLVWKVISPHQLGFPQSRQRVYIVGRHRRKLGGASVPFQWPAPTAPPTQSDLHASLLPDDQVRQLEPECFRELTACVAAKLTTLKARLHAAGATWSADQPVIVDPNTSAARLRLGTVGTSLCVTTRAYGFYILGKDRYLSSIEALRLQGFEHGDIEQRVLNEETPRRQRYKMAGNTMHIGTVQRVLGPLVNLLQP